MSLLKRHDLDRFVQRLLSLHSTMSLLKRKLRNNLLRAGLRFTFHYVAIKTLTDVSRKQLRIAFTFHYVAIKTAMSIQSR